MVETPRICMVSSTQLTMWQPLSGLCPLPWWHQLVSSAIDDIITQLGKEKEDEEGRSASTSNDSHERPRSEVLDVRKDEGAALEAN